ncbi:MAG: glycosyltransferase [Lachnospiraceae bacterium]
MQYSDKAATVIKEINNALDGHGMPLDRLDTLLHSYMKCDKQEREMNAAYLSLEGAKIVAKTIGYPFFYYFLSFFVESTNNQELYQTMVDCCLMDESLSRENKYFLYWRFVLYGFRNPDKIPLDVSKTMLQLYRQIYELFLADVKNDMHYIPKEDRNKDFVMVFTGQFLALNHAPTKTALDRCYVIAKKLKKKVMLINTAELATVFQAVDYFDMGTPNYVEEYFSLDIYPYKDEEFLFYQCPKEMPQMAVMREILRVVQEEKPYFVLNIGGNSILSDLCSNIVPTLSVATVFSGKSTTMGQFQAIGRPINEEDMLWLKESNLPEDYLLPSLFTFVFKEQEHHYLRRELGFPENAFVVVLVGGRLDSEISEEIETLMEELMHEGICFAFAGTYKRYQKMKEKRPVFEKMGINLGFQDDILAIDECCDLCLNPPRIGGGSSVAEALYKGVPVVSLNYGDGGLAAGEDFWVKDLEDMKNTILRYREDAKFYEEQSKKAVERGLQLTDSDGEFIKIIRKMEESPRF